MIWILLISMDQHIWLLMSCAGPGHSAHEWLWFLAKSMPQVWHTWIWWTLGISFIPQMNIRCLKIYWTSIPPSVSLPLAVARWYILQVKCPKQRQQKEPQSDHERKIAAVLSAWFGCFFCEILGARALEVGKPTRSFSDNQLTDFIVALELSYKVLLVLCSLIFWISSRLALSWGPHHQIPSLS